MGRAAGPDMPSLVASKIDALWQAAIHLRQNAMCEWAV